MLFDDAVVLAHHHPHVTVTQSLTRLPYLFGVAVYAFEVRARSYGTPTHEPVPQKLPSALRRAAALQTDVCGIPGRASAWCCR